jgi:hypothetical protein
MSITNEQLAELLAGIVRSQQAIVDAIERAEPGYRNTHLLPVLTVAANMRAANARLLDLPSRILLRSQGRNAMDGATILRDLELALSAPAGAVQDAYVPPNTYMPKGSAAAMVAAQPAAAPAAAGGDDEMDFTAKS